MTDKELIKQIRTIFDKKMYKCKTKLGDYLMCSINEAFEEFHEFGHNCLGCNLHDQANLIRSFLRTANKYEDRNQFFTVYLFLLYVMTERIKEIMKIIGLPQTYKEKDLKVFKEIKIWANFLKHPKAFIFTHHPTYIFENEKYTKGKRIIIDYSYILRFYSGEDQNKYKQLISELKNNHNVLVILPDLVRVTNEFCDACATFIDIIKDNKAYKEILNDLTTLQNYFEGLEYDFAS